ncbi:MAG: glycosyltransferase N-terminal domain-containing protein [Bacteroidota bacterium]
MLLLYNLGIHIYHLLIRFAALFNNKARLWIAGRKGIFEQLSKTLAPTSAPLIWVHCASLGEFEQARPVIEALKKEKKTTQILLTFFSPSGYEIRKDYNLADHVFYLPIDTPSNAKRFLDLTKPDLVFFVKYEFWYHYLQALHKRQIPAYLISATFHPKQPFFNKIYGRFFRSMLYCFRRIFVQNEASAKLLDQLNISHFEVAGDTRIDRVLAIAEKAERIPKIEAFKGNQSILIGGSTWPPDEKILTAFINQDQSDWKYIIAPHDISLAHMEQIEQLLNVPHQRYSSFRADLSSKVLIIDNIGLLSRIYQYGKLAYIGGGFGVGIHNTLEPIAFRLPVLFGPKYEKFEEATQLLATGGAFLVEEYADFEQHFLYLQATENHQIAASAASAYLSANQGATERIMEYLRQG